MRRKVTACAPSNIAFIKYWGARDLDRALPWNPSISMTLSRSVARTTVELLPHEEGPDVVHLVDGEGRLVSPPERFRLRVLRHLDRIRSRGGARGRFVVATRTSFPSDAGLASSAAGFAALAVAASGAQGRLPSAAELSTLARLSGSGSAARSVLGGYVVWPDPHGGEDSPAVQLAPPDHWELSDVIAVVDRTPKEVSSREGHRRAPTSPHFAARQALLPGRTARVKQAIVDRDLAVLGPLLEEEAIELHLVAMSSRPPIFYWVPSTLRVLEEVRRLRNSGVHAWFTLDAGPNAHVICPPAFEARVARALGALSEVQLVLTDRTGGGPRLDEEHLF